MRYHIAPRDLETTLNLQYGNTNTRTQRLDNLGDNTLATADTPSGRHRIHLTKDRQFPSFTAVNPDGVTSALRPERGSLQYQSTESKEPDSEISTNHLAVVAEALHSQDDDKNYAARRAEDHQQIMATGAYLAHQYVLTLQQATEGHVWPHGRLADLIQPHHPDGPAYTQPESTSEYMVRRADGSSSMTTRITPANAVVCDYDTVQTDLLA